MNNDTYPVRIYHSGGRAFIVLLCGIVTLASLFYIGCSTLKSDAKAAERQIIMDGRAVGKTLAIDGQQVIQLTIDALNAYRTNADFRASVDKDIAAAALVAAKVP
jgi:hypothetical protein